MSSLQKSTFADFCEAWGSRFPGSELPAAWEEDVRANLKKHKTKVSILREELEKEEMYVEYLDKLLADIERHRKSTCEDDNNDEAFVRDIATNSVTSRFPSKVLVVVDEYPVLCKQFYTS